MSRDKRQRNGAELVNRRIALSTCSATLLLLYLQRGNYRTVAHLSFNQLTSIVNFNFGSHGLVPGFIMFLLMTSLSTVIVSTSGVAFVMFVLFLNVTFAV